MNLAMAPEFQLRVRRDEPMAKHTSWRVGGAADVFFTPRDRDDLAAFLRALPPATPLLWVGLGSNLLVRDGGIRGAVICTHGAFTRLERRAQLRVYCEAGVPCARLARQCAAWGLGHADFFAGIPGTLGGALIMNAGAYGGETWRQVRAVDVMARDGSCRTRQASEYQAATAMSRRRPMTSGSWPRSWNSRRATPRPPAPCASWHSAASRPSHSASGAAVRYSPIRPATTPRA